MSQEELDLEGAKIESRWNEQAYREAVNWSEKALCITWVWPGVDWRNNEDWWLAQPKYLQRHYLWLWRMNQDRIDRGFPGYDFKTANGLFEDGIQRNEALAKRWASIIREAAVRGETVPIKAEPRYQYILDRACELAGVLVLGGAR